MAKTAKSKFLENVRRGRKFEAEERAGWNHIEKEHVKFEAPTSCGSKRGRVDIKIDEGETYIAIIEIKGTDWAHLKPQRVRFTAQRHARQIWRYVDDYLDNHGKEVCPALVYEYEPEDPTVRAEVEQILNDRCIQVVWRKEKRS